MTSRHENVARVNLIGRDVPDSVAVPLILERMKSRTVISEKGCWELQGFRNAKGYTHVCFRGKPWRAHRLSYVIHKGEIPKGKLVCHACDVPYCWNPDHLWLGTIWENGQDAKHKKRCKYQKTTTCKNGHAWIEGVSYRLTKEGFKQCLLCSRIRQRIKSGWPKDLAESAPKVPAGYSAPRRSV